MHELIPAAKEMDHVSKKMVIYYFYFDYCNGPGYVRVYVFQSY